MKFVNFTNASARRPEDQSENPYGRKARKAIPAPSLPPPRSTNNDLKELLKVMKPEPKAAFESKMLRASKILTEERIKNETEDILAILRNLHKK